MTQKASEYGTIGSRVEGPRIAVSVATTPPKVKAYNVADEPVNWRDFTWALAQAYRTPRPFELPRCVLRLVAPYLAFMMTSTLRASNARAKRELDWTPSLPSYRDGIRHMTAFHGVRSTQSDSRKVRMP
ncbi:MAG TPA: hypothetical protein VN178_13045 [Rubrobacter sp.]|jgi:nucleoside-diphosphate-sugar epimerase|nr:hypothetical protein [Rubrobacter sp.]